MTRRERTERTLTDVRALRALAHPVRQQLVEDVLSTDEPLTATEAAARCGITPSAMSYHLRALEKWGMVERVDSGDGRERPWRKTADGFKIDNSDGADMPLAEQETVVTEFLRSATQNLVSGMREDDDSLTLWRASLLLTEQETNELDAELSRLVDRYRDLHEPGDPGVKRRRTFWLNASAEPRPTD
ncbi:helix-turn-helix domain-containing protein [Allobranchiibius sp. GilTou73]|uniref:winged helix-turn-helix domain-containing protein n=1 Tax=Allobranchiibius sp. GilTou73 TaxID=2904523 RepID=UPI001F164E98|nr:helix-turn-helix domain-containing protein [Allobranchiibius sp. GilTou73]UIJ35887.1 helix-turn-helix domain-containing protein [Allobranchiibius sp. GilTou73]